MAVDADTFLTYDAKGNREDLSDVIYRISPTETPFMSGIEKGSASAVLHEWQTQALRAAVSTNKVLEGDDATTVARTPTVRLTNYCQIADEVARVSGTQRAVKHAGRGDEMDYQVSLASMELKRDVETQLLANLAKNAGAEGTERVSGSILSWIATNDDLSTAGSPASPAGTGADTRTDGTQRAFKESQLKTVLQSCWDNGGNPDTIMVGGFNKQAFSTFTGRATPTEDTKAKKIVAAVSAYESDFGTLKVVANRFSRSRDALVLQMDMWEFVTLRPFTTKELAKTGDSERKQIIVEYSLQSSNEAASGGVFDLTTS
jgi:hypothetical protein